MASSRLPHDMGLGRGPDSLIEFICLFEVEKAPFKHTGHYLTIIITLIALVYIYAYGI
jgi:hypothetical protein